jgi:erythronate-4-phosphate dehydrogenase
MKIVADYKIPFLNGVFEPFADVVYLQGNKIKKSDLIDADALITRTRTKCNQELLEGTSVKFIATATIGFDHIDAEYCKKNNIAWANAPGCNSGSVQQWLMAALLYYAKEDGIDLTTRTLGVIGIGNVGSKIVKFAENIGMRVILNDPPKAEKEGTCGYLSMDSILRESDIVTFHIPLNKSGKYPTFYMVNEGLLGRLMPGSIFINSSRGEVVDTQALRYAIDSGKLAGALLDVWENEPEIDSKILDLASIATPHIAGYSMDGKANGTAMSVSALSKFFNFPLTDWFPDELPSREIMQYTIDAKKKSYQSVLTEAVLRTYDIMADDKALRSNLSEFENLRGNYPIRREFMAWTIKLDNDNKNYKTRLENLGFKIKT